MNVARYNHTATLLPNGEVVVAGGESGTAATLTWLAGAELYDPKTGEWMLTRRCHLFFWCSRQSGLQFNGFVT